MKASKLRNMPLETLMTMADGSRGKLVGVTDDGGRGLVTVRLQIDGRGIDDFNLDYDDEVEVHNTQTFVTACEAIQFRFDPDTIGSIRKFLGVNKDDIESHKGIYVRNFKKYQPNKLFVTDGPWVGDIEEREWLVKRDGQITVLSDYDFKVLFA